MKEPAYTKKMIIKTFPLPGNRVMDCCEILTVVKLYCNATCYLTLAI